MRPIEGQPGLYRLDNGNIISTRDMRPVESSSLVKGIEWVWPTEHLYVLQCWHFTCAVWPKNPVSVQQVVELHIGQYKISEAILLSLLTCVERTVEPVVRPNNIISGHVEPTQVVRVKLAEQPVEGAGLRVHLRGFQKILKQYGGVSIP